MTLKFNDTKSHTLIDISPLNMSDFSHEDLWIILPEELWKLNKILIMLKKMKKIPGSNPWFEFEPKSNDFFPPSTKFHSDLSSVFGVILYTKPTKKLT